MAALAKLLAEAGPEEVKVILGWRVNFRNLTMALPKNKHVTWRASILNMLKMGKSSYKELERTVDWMVHVGVAIP